MNSKLADNIKRNKKIWSVYLIMVVMLLIFYIFLMKFSFAKASSHFIDMTRQAATLGLMAFGQTCALLIGGIDLSVGAVCSVTNIMVTRIMAGDPNRMFLAIGFCILFSLFIGCLNGLAVTKLKLPPFLVTLAMTQLIKGAYMLYTGGMMSGSLAPEFRQLSSGWVGPAWGITQGLIPIADIVWIGAFAILCFVLSRTRFGRDLYAVGGNRETARLTGINSDSVIIRTYMLSSFLACCAGLMVTAYVGASFLHIGESYEMDSIAATCIGGTTFAGGVGSIVGTLAGVMIVHMLSSIATMVGLQDAGRLIMLGVVLIIALSTNHFMTRSDRR
jgi:ribose transport system permease protein